MIPYTFSQTVLSTHIGDVKGHGPESEIIIGHGKNDGDDEKREKVNKRDEKKEGRVIQKEERGDSVLTEKKGAMGRGDC